MLRACVWSLLLLLLTGCTFQPNRASQAVDFDPLAIGSGEPVLRPASGPGYFDGVSQNMRRR